MKFLRFEEFQANENCDLSYYTKKINLVKDPSDYYDAIQESVLSQLYNTSDWNRLTETKLDKKLPTLFWANQIPISEDFNKYSTSYNSPKLIDKAGNRKTLYSILEKENCSPKTVYDRYDSHKLKFPVVAKAKYKKDGESKIFNSFKELKSAKESYSLFQEYLTPSKKIEVLFFNGKPISVYEKKDGTKVLQDLDKNTALIESINKIGKKIYDSTKLNAFSSSIFVNEDNSAVATNLKTGNKLETKDLVSMYCHIYESTGQTLPAWFKHNITEKFCSDYTGLKTKTL